MAAGGPDIGALLAGLGAGGGVGPGPGGPPPGGDEEGGSVTDLLGHALDLINEAYGKEKDPIFKEKMGKIASLIDAIFAEEQKQKDQALGGANLSLLRRG